MTDSGSLASMSSIIHKLAAKGEYRGIVYRGTLNVGTFIISVCDCAEPPSPGEILPKQTGIDLVTLDTSAGRTSRGGGPSLSLRTGGFLVLSVSTGYAEYAVELFRRELKTEPKKVFDSRKLGTGDLFITHIIRPGTYEIRNCSEKTNASLTVEYPGPGQITGRIPPVVVECKEHAMNPAILTIQPRQALMFSCVQDSRITIELKQADDRPRPARTPVTVRPARQKKKTTGMARPEKILRKIQFFG
jgi:hypothetical protein